MKTNISVFCIANGIIHQTFCSHNRVTKIKDTYFEWFARCCSYACTHILWSDVICACHLINLISSLVLYGKTPFSWLFPDKAVFYPLPHVFGWTCFVQDLYPDLHKFSPVLWNVCLLATYSKWYRCYHHVSRKYFTSADITFWVYSLSHLTIICSSSSAFAGAQYKCWQSASTITTAGVFSLPRSANSGHIIVQYSISNCWFLIS